VSKATPYTLVADNTKRQTRREAGAQSLRASTTNERQPGRRKGTTHGSFAVSPKRKTNPIARRLWPWQSYHPLGPVAGWRDIDPCKPWVVEVEPLCSCSAPLRKVYRMRRTIVLLAAMAAIVVGYAGTALAEEPTTDTLDAHYLDETAVSYNGFNQNYQQGQTFTVENTGHLTKADVKVWRSFETTSDLKMKIVSVNAASGLPTNNVLASASIPASEIVTFGGGAMETFTFSNPAVVRAGKQYAFVMDGTEGQSYDFGFEMDSFNGTSPGYPGGQGYWLNHDYTVSGTIPDHIFAIYVSPGDFPDVTSPVLSLPGDITKEAEGPNGATVSWPAPTATDDVDDSVTVNCDKTSGDIFPLGTTTVTCSATDAAGNTASDSFAVTVQDATLPTLSVSHTPDGTNGWNKTSAVSLSVSASDTDSGVAAAPTCTDGSTALTLTAGPTAGNWTASVSGEGTHDVSCSVSDNADNSTNASDTVKIDTSAPSISDLGPTTQPNAAGWYKTNVTNRFKASDSGSGLNGACQRAFPAKAAGNNVQSKSTSGEGSSLKVTSASCTDVAGNTATGIDSATFKIDKTAPKVSAATPTGTGIGRGTNVVATFSERMGPASITNSTFKLFRCTSSTTCTTQVTNVTLSKSTDGLGATINPYGTSSTLLAANTKYKVVVTTSTQDLAGNALDQEPMTAGNQQKSWTFTTKG
jgi:hypothetical protein